MPGCPGRRIAHDDEPGRLHRPPAHTEDAAEAAGLEFGLRHDLHLDGQAGREFDHGVGEGLGVEVRRGSVDEVADAVHGGRDRRRPLGKSGIGGRRDDRDARRRQFGRLE